MVVWREGRVRLGSSDCSLVDVVAPGLFVEGHTGKLGDEVRVDGPEEKDDDVARVLRDGAFQISQHGSHDGGAKRVEEVEDQIVVGEGELGGVGVDGFDGGAAAGVVAEAFDVGLSFAMEIG
jgi:hypothetical protein